MKKHRDLVIYINGILLLLSWILCGVSNIPISEKTILLKYICKFNATNIENESHLLENTSNIIQTNSTENWFLSCINCNTVHFSSVPQSDVTYNNSILNDLESSNQSEASRIQMRKLNLV